MNSKLLCIAACLCLLSVNFGCGKMVTKAKQAKPVKVRTVEASSATSGVRYSATIRPAAQVDVAFKVGGYVDLIGQQGGRYLQAGDIVRKGTVLARVRQSDYVAKVNEVRSQHAEAVSAFDTNSAQLKEADAAVDTARAQARDAQASFDRAALDFERAQTLYSTKSMTKPDYDAAKAQHEISKAKLDAAVGQLKSAEARVAVARSQIGAARSRIKTMEASRVSATIPLQDTELRAPMSAVVIERKIELGTLVSQGTPGFVIADLTSVKAAFGVPDVALQSLKLGDTISITTDGAPASEYTGHVSRISPAADPNSRVFDVEVTIFNADGMLKPGMIASLSVNEGPLTPTEVPLVPLTAITRSKQDPNAYAVFVVEERGGKQYARARQVVLGESSGNAIAVTSGVQPGEVVITTGSTQVADGEEVAVMP